MPSTNKTGYLNLTQYQSDDITSWLEDYNSDMRKIDTGVQANHVEITDAMSAIQTNTQNITTNTQNIQNLITEAGETATEISDIQSSLTTMNGAISGVTTRMTTAEGEVDALQQSYQTLNGQVATNTSDISNLKRPLQFIKTQDFHMQNHGGKIEHTMSLQPGIYVIFYDVLVESTLPSGFVRPTLINGIPSRTNSTLIVADYGYVNRTTVTPPTTSPVYRFVCASIVTCYVEGTDNFNADLCYLTDGATINAQYSIIRSGTEQGSIYKLAYE